MALAKKQQTEALHKRRVFDMMVAHLQATAQ
jgi:hypothetical protein